jgi:hypothetical protein
MTEKPARGRRRASRSTARLTPLPPGVETPSALVLAGRPVDEALDTDLELRRAYARLAAGVLDGMLDRGRANAAVFALNALSQRIDREREWQARLRELDLRAEEIATARDLQRQLEEYRARVPASLLHQIGIHVPALLDAAAGSEGERPALEVEPR